MENNHGCPLGVEICLFEISPIAAIHAVVLPSCTKHNLVMDAFAKLADIAVSITGILG
jgi:hypothetical protein